MYKGPVKILIFWRSNACFLNEVVLVLVLLCFALLCIECPEMFTRGGATVVSLLVKP